MTITQILALVDEMYPNTTSPATKIVYMNSAIDELAREFGRHKTDTSVLTVEDLETYSLPSDCIDLSHVDALWVANRPAYVIGAVWGADATHVTLDTNASDVDDAYNGKVITITDGTGAGQDRTISDYDGLTRVATVSVAWTTNPDTTSEWALKTVPYALVDSDYVPYTLGMQNDNPKGYCTFYDMGVTAVRAVQSFGLSPVPDADDYPILIRYRSKCPSYTVANLATEPDIDPRWHDALVYYIIYMCASIGAVPDSAIANFWGAKYDGSIKSYKMAEGRRDSRLPKRRRDNPQWSSRAW